MERVGGSGRGLRLFGREIGILRFVFRNQLLISFQLEEPTRGGAVDAIGLGPKSAADLVWIVVEAQRDKRSEVDRVSFIRMVVVELGGAHANGGIEAAAVIMGVLNQGAEGGGDGVCLLVNDLIGHVVRTRIGFLLKNLEFAVEFVLQNGGQRLGGSRNVSERG